MHPPTTRVLLLHSSTLLRQGVIELLKRHAHIEVVAETAAAEDVAHFALSHRPHVVVMEMGSDGLETCRSLAAALPHVPLVLLGASRDLSLIVRAFRAGGTIYLPPDVPVEALVQCIEEAHRSGRHAGPYLAQPPQDHHKPADSPVSRREREVLGLIAQGKANKEIGRVLAISENTVRNHIANIFGKLGVRDRTEAAVQAVKRGIV